MSGITIVAILAPTVEASVDWRRGFLRSFLERDLPQLGVRVPSPTLHRFWRMLLSRVDLGEESHATPSAIADGVMYLRTEAHLLSIGR